MDVTRPAGCCCMLASSNVSSAMFDVTARPFPRYMVPVLHFAISRYAPHPFLGSSPVLLESAF